MGKSCVVVNNGKERDSANDMGNIRWPVGANRAGDFGVGPAQGEGAQKVWTSARCWKGSSSDAQFLPMGPLAQGTGG